MSDENEVVEVVELDNKYLKGEWLAQRPEPKIIKRVGRPFTQDLGYFYTKAYSVPGGPFAVAPGETLTVKFTPGSEQDAKVVIERPEPK